MSLLAWQNVILSLNEKLQRNELSCKSIVNNKTHISSALESKVTKKPTRRQTNKKILMIDIDLSQKPKKEISSN
jgi:hypothetical protein